ncbi:hypothetical protein EPUS_05688 [Endocarpon pusillum Z07020]|uniref:Heterokaryon incompatibility domain-containing protein n=1 Tax=Endocarpon pusillum (strain Z07020 / HMAS-L-300199) TaxID=1263415 RepID=U1HTR7_ENDPU|nr:uncharacterized protein EPUS_05688 [Endocarpon pusillum Z07020]ERF72634.1 hypothetical protein EPUS_05688 [Endocarpon pusillum Z07020]
MAITMRKRHAEADVYRPLMESRQEIRLLRIHASLSFKSPIKCDLIQTPLDHALDFQALSYVWGNKVDKSSISVLGTDFPVTRNPFEALIRLRQKTRTLIIWIDAAKGVLVWLGEKIGNSDLAFRLIRTWAKYALDNRPDTLVQLYKHTEFEPYVFDYRAWDAAKELFERDWWFRVWVYQEFVLAQEATFVYGPDRISWLALRHAMQAWTYVQSPTVTGYFTIAYRHLVENCRFEVARQFISDREKMVAAHIGTNPHLLALPWLVDNLRFLRSTDPRDKVYALLGVADTENLVIDIDYSKSVHEVYAKYIWAVAQKDHCLNVLAQAGLARDGRSSDLRLPSWVPDLRTACLATTKLQQAEHWPSGCETAKYDLSADLSTLTISGSTFDSIQELEQELHSGPNTDLRVWRDLAFKSGLKTHPAGIPLHQAFFRTII